MPDPITEFPLNFYFNGELMPRWASSWAMIPLLEPAEEFMRLWDGATGYRELFNLHCRIDHVTNIESSDSDVFRLCSLTLAFLMLRDEPMIRASVASECLKYGGTRDEVFEGVLNGLFAMARLCPERGNVFWTNGDERNLETLREYRRRHQLPREDPDWLEAPHRLQDTNETAYLTNSVRRAMIALLNERPISKPLRRLIHEIPKPSANKS